MKKILATLAGTVALALGAGACSAVDTQEAQSIAPIADTLAAPAFTSERMIREHNPNRSATRPVKPAISAHEAHVNHLKQVAAAKAAKAAKDRAAAKAKAIKLAQAKAVKLAKYKAWKAKQKAVVKKSVKKATTKAKKVSLSGIASCIAKYESGGNPRAQNPHSTASGLFQFIDGTWNHFGGYARAMYAPVSVQLKKFYIVWDGGRGAHNWVVAPKCGW